MLPRNGEAQLLQGGHAGGGRELLVVSWHVVCLDSREVRDDPTAVFRVINLLATRRARRALPPLFASWSRDSVHLE